MILHFHVGGHFLLVHMRPIGRDEVFVDVYDSMRDNHYVDSLKNVIPYLAYLSYKYRKITFQKLIKEEQTIVGNDCGLFVCNTTRNILLGQLYGNYEYISHLDSI